MLFAAFTIAMRKSIHNTHKISYGSSYQVQVQRQLHKSFYGSTFVIAVAPLGASNVNSTVYKFSFSLISPSFSNRILYSCC